MRISRFSIILFLIGEAEANSLNKKAGLKLANNSNSFLNPSKACSGLCSQSKSSHCGAPTAPNNMASEALASDKTSKAETFTSTSPVYKSLFTVSDDLSTTFPT